MMTMSKVVQILEGLAELSMPLEGQARAWLRPQLGSPPRWQPYVPARSNAERRAPRPRHRSWPPWLAGAHAWPRPHLGSQVRSCGATGVAAPPLQEKSDHNFALLRLVKDLEK
jgi:hypothetical protein